MFFAQNNKSSVESTLVFNGFNLFSSGLRQVNYGEDDDTSCTESALRSVK